MHDMLRLIDINVCCQRKGVERAGCKQAQGDKVRSGCGSFDIHLNRRNLHGRRPHLEDKLAEVLQRQPGRDTWGFQIGVSSRGDRIHEQHLARIIRYVSFDKLQINEMCENRYEVPV